MAKTESDRQPVVPHLKAERIEVNRGQTGFKKQSWNQ
jgi:hypothetical protein